MITVIVRPAVLDGCFSNWSEQYTSPSIRTSMENPATIKTRRRFTGQILNIEASLTIKSIYRTVWHNWYNVSCAGGSLPTRVKNPDGVELVVRFTEPPKIEFTDSNKDAVRVSVKMEQLPDWKTL
jgi:hypothetical protein